MLVAIECAVLVQAEISHAVATVDAGEHAAQYEDRERRGIVGRPLLALHESAGKQRGHEQLMPA